MHQTSSNVLLQSALPSNVASYQLFMGPNAIFNATIGQSYSFVLIDESNTQANVTSAPFIFGSFVLCPYAFTIRSLIWLRLGISGPVAPFRAAVTSTVSLNVIFDQRDTLVIRAVSETVADCATGPNDDRVHIGQPQSVTGKSAVQLNILASTPATYQLCAL